MGKSYKKHPSCGSTITGGKRKANRKVRRALKDPAFDASNRKYRKLTCNYDVKDYREVAPSFETFCIEQLEVWHKWPKVFKNRKDNSVPPTRDELRQRYNRWYRRK